MKCEIHFAPTLLCDLNRFLLLLDLFFLVMILYMSNGYGNGDLAKQ